MRDFRHTMVTDLSAMPRREAPGPASVHSPGLTDAAMGELEDIIIIVDRDRRPVGGNWATRSTGLSVPLNLLPGCFGCGRADERQCTVCHLQSVIDSGVPQAEVLQDDAVSYSIQVWRKPLRDEAGAVIGAIIILRDMTELKQAEAALNAGRAASEKENNELVRAIDYVHELAMETEADRKSMANFLANMSHEIRTPMNGVLGMTELLKGTTLNEEQRDYVDTASRSAEALLGIINDILDFSKIEAGKLDLETIPFDLGGILDEVGELLALKAHEKGLDFIVVTEPDLPRLVLGDPTRVRQAVINLVGNAIKFTAVGEVEIHAAMVGSAPDTLTVRLSVRDTGIGISPAAQLRLFKPFTQADDSTTREFGGTGLGLSICRLLVDMMGGEIGVDSVPGTGSTFWMTMTLGQVSAEAAAVVPEPAAPQPALLASRRILILDENPAVARHLAALFTAWGARQPVIPASEALRNLVGNPEFVEPGDVVLVDQKILAANPTDWLAVASRAHLLVLEKLGRRNQLPGELSVRLAGHVTKPVRPRVLGGQMQALLENVSRKGPAAPITRDRPAWHEQADLQHLRVLIAEDNPVNQKVVTRFLVKMGVVDTVVVANGEEALAQLRDGDFDVVLMDIMMPVMGGSEAIAHIRAGRHGVRRRDVPIIALTANALVGDREKILAGGADDYLAKPLKAEALSGALAKWALTRI